MASSWGTSPMADLALTLWVVSGRPSTTTRPSSASSSPATIEMTVVFPAPFGPSRPKVSDGWMWRSTPSTATRSPNAFLRPVASTTAASVEVVVETVGAGGMGRILSWPVLAPFIP